MQSARIHDLKINLMVNALKCRSVSPLTLRDYGQLVDQRGGEFARHERAVQRSLGARYGDYQAAALFDDYETRIGNYHSNTQPSREACEDTAAFIRLAARADSAELETLSRLVTSRGIRACPVERPVEFATVPDDEPGLDEPTEIVDGIPTYSTPGTGRWSAPEPLERVEMSEPVSEPVSEPASADQATRLAAAIDALDAAAEALRGMQSAPRPPAR